MNTIPKAIYRIAYISKSVSFLSEDYTEQFTNKKEAVAAARKANQETNQKVYQVVTFRRVK